MNHAEVANRVLAAIGADNLQAAAHCATRLRLVIKDESKIDQTALDNDPDVKGTFETNGQYQIIIGPGDVDKVYAALIAKTGLKEATPDDIKAAAQAGKKKNPLMDFLKVLSDIFIPIVPALVAGGLLMALNNVLTAEHLFMAKSVVEVYPGLKDVADMINVMAAAPFTFLPILLGFSATKRFGGNGYLGATMGMIMVLPSLVNGNNVAAVTAAGKMTYWHVFGLNIAQAGYQGQVLPVLAVAFILATLEKFFHKHIKSAFDFTFTPMLSIIITGFLTFTIVGPVLRTVSDWLTNGLVGLYNTTGWVGMGIFGLLYSAIVITGLHQTFPAIETQLLANVAKTGGSFIFPVASMANIAQGAATLAIFFATKSQKQKALTSSAGISALLGITEPAIFGVNLKMKFPFVCAAIASGIACVFLGLFHVLSVAMGPASVIGFISIASKSIPAFMLCALIAFVLGFVSTFIYAKRVLGDDADPVEAPVQPVAPAAVNDEILTAPISGTSESLRDVNDQVFSAEIMGHGVAIIPTSDQVLAPADGVVTVTYDSRHAYGIKTNDGAEILIHLGLDTVNLNGDHFTSQVEKGATVHQGDVLGTMDVAALKAANYDPTVMLIVTNTTAYANVERLQATQVTAGDKVLALTQPANGGVAAALS
ncbi:sucrose-specific PTS transporter subunit IIBC [Lactiplantibacillus mudanjiangensis]|uniref:protein-N(pi)-phosphohistidine--sucrose phosphotransferase n=1 Tax=Lactiplantibacillus mudanjiangensis TaxID=1296538 RepID=A0A660DW51_9LACO|nr:sucrose-specific PTS transporter subunit IIBC [Lactiplantibacillus mudanjiangensis]VDG20271.1 PTS beta-glucoside transporter subunit EIIBCA [Lactobacillus alimentarius DSM] [Lactiplantibacillus mudanjiangensis]VDG24039.1 PTS beta-glucoside transporter subunit EIIBCA [Lactobacillus alimentarius DSM] [Lactiplantibacillus mudanjiangensis]VDG27283.1 PTS beta-glucoside transporter subunit EIIBCA [Lactobacillus alimentarius DSM] [Lactiplantibacillus mudanjiangensis]VDG33865.1 PTS beta-glucoside tr